MEFVYSGLALAFLFLVGILAHSIHSHVREKNVDRFPGPYGLPLLGRFWDLPRRHAYKKFKAWSNQYGPIYQINIFGVNHIWLASERIARDLLEGKRSIHNSDRPAIMNVKDSRGSGHYLPLLGHNEKWKRQRKFIHHKMSWSITLKHRDIPYQETFQMLADIIDRPDRYEEIMDDYTGRVISRVCYGRVESFREIKATSFALLGAISPSENLTNLIPFLSYIPYYLSPWKQTEQRRYEKERRLFFRLQEHVRYEGDKLEDSFMKQYLKSEKKEVPEEEAAYAIGMTALAGMLTTASIKINYILAACHYPSWQAAIQQEIDLICGDRMVKACDAPNLPTLRAVIKELIRWRPIIPASIPHQTEQDDWYDGRFIPAGTRIHPNSWALSHDPELYPDPEAFNPDRWLKPEYPTFKEPLTTYPTIRNMFIFGFGRRVCMGQDLVEAELIVAIGNLAWACNISQKLGLDGKPMPIPIDASAASYTAQLISRPKTFPFELVPRSENRAQQVRENLEAYKGI